MSGAEAESLLAECRRKIDKIDSQLRDLLNQRAAIVDDVVRAKEALGIPIHEPRREEEVIRGATNGNPGPLGDDAFRAIFEAIMREMRNIQQVYMDQHREKSK
jgi:chorismate mutase